MVSHWAMNPGLSSSPHPMRAKVLRFVVAALSVLGLSCLSVTARAAGDVYDEFTGGRSLAMGGAHRGIGSGNDTLFLNPAGMALPRRYSIEMQYGYSPFDKISHISASAVDSKSGPVAGGVGYTYDRGGSDANGAGLNRFYLGFAYALGENVAIGATNRYVRGNYRDAAGVEHSDLSLYNLDAGIMFNLGEAISLGVAYNNIVKTDEPLLQPSTLGFGAGLTLMGLVVGADAEIFVNEKNKGRYAYHVGGEYVLAEAYPIRIGYSREPFLQADQTYALENLMSAGLGWLNGTAGIDIAYRQSLERSKNWMLVGTLRFFL